jgi:hypothetical protein
MKAMAGEDLPHLRPALLDSGKSAAIHGLLMLRVRHALIIRDLCLRNLASRHPPASRMLCRGRREAASGGKRTVSLKSMDFALWEQSRAGGYSVDHLSES